MTDRVPLQTIYNKDGFHLQFAAIWTPGAQYEGRFRFAIGDVRRYGVDINHWGPVGDSLPLAAWGRAATPLTLSSMHRS
ncbi:hypothetical protein SAMN05216532_8470 [Streptomyces sp. 2231.1]|nr:hypothetical protein SAMN05216532_8470 [Streptomyces sp. 2231.1]